MKFTRFTLQNFRGISSSLSINLDDYPNRPICVVGNNESGKTTLLEGISAIGKLCKGEDVIVTKHATYRPKMDMGFTGTMELSTQLRFAPKDLRQLAESAVSKKDGKNPSENAAAQRAVSLVKDNDNCVEIVFTYDFSLNLLVKDKIWVSIRNFSPEEGKIVIEAIRKTAPEIIYLEDFIFDVPDLSDSAKRASVTTTKN